MKRDLLFVTCRDDDFGDGLTYALDLAKMMDKGISVLLLNKRRLSKKFEDLMTAITFAEANEHGSAIEILKESTEGEKGDVQHIIKEKCHGSGISATIYTALSDAVSALKDFMRQNHNIDMVLLSPSVTENGNLSSKELNKLVRVASRPIVTISKNAQLA